MSRREDASPTTEDDELEDRVTILEFDETATVELSGACQ